MDLRDPQELHQSRTCRRPLSRTLQMATVLGNLLMLLGSQPFATPRTLEAPHDPHARLVLAVTGNCRGTRSTAPGDRSGARCGAAEYSQEPRDNRSETAAGLSGSADRHR